MGWADFHIVKLKEGNTVNFRPKGNSMQPRIKSGQLCQVEPILDYQNIKVNDIVLCKVKGNQYLHCVSAIDGERFQISNNSGFINGWINKNALYGKLLSVKP